MRIALDAMGGDFGPEPVVQGAAEAAEQLEGLEIVLVGDRQQIESCLTAAKGPAHRLEIFHCSQVIGMDESPVVGLRKKPDSSITRCWELMAGRTVDAVVSAGNTGAVVGAGLKTRLFLKGVKRPGIAVVLPTLKGPCVLIDVGANVFPKPEHLFQYGVMGSLYAQHILKIEHPAIAVLNVGEEERKGNELVRETHALFESSHLRDRFIGNVEGRDIYRGTSDVIVCDGFVGNVVLKVCEGLAEMVFTVAQQEVLGRLSAERDLARAAFQDIVQRYDYSAFGGAPLLGIDGICIICHGASGGLAIRNAIRVAANFADDHLNDLITEELNSSPRPAIAGE